MSIYKKTAISLMVPIFTACSTTYVQKDVDETFNVDDCAGYRTTVENKMKGEGEDAKVVENLRDETNIIFVDPDCLKDKHKSETGATVLAARVEIKKEAMRGANALTLIELRDPLLPPEARQKIIYETLEALNDGYEDIRRLGVQSLEQASMSQEEFLQFHIADLLRRVETTTGPKQQKTIEQLVSIHLGEKFENNFTLGKLAQKILREDVEGFEQGKTLYKASLSKQCDFQVGEDGTLVADCITLPITLEQ